MQPHNIHDDQLLEYLYGCAEDPAAIERALAEDPALAARLEQVRSQADLLNAAAQDTPPALDLRAPAPSRQSTPRQSTPRQGNLIQGFFAGTPWRKLASAALVLALVAPWLWSLTARSEAQRLSRSDLRVVASAPSGVTAGSRAQVRVETWDLDGDAAPAELVWQLLDAEGRELAAGEQRTEGTAELAFEPQFGEDFAAAAKVRLVARRGDTSRELEVPLTPGRDLPLAHLASDKPVYRPGETVRLRAVVLDRLSLAPREGRFHLRLVDTQGAPAKSWVHDAKEGVLGAEFVLPEDARGGSWAFELRDGRNQFTVERLPLMVRHFQAPRLDKDLQLAAKTFAPGELASAELAVQRLTGGPAAGAQVLAELWLDGERRGTQELTLDADGRGLLALPIPERVERGEARLVARITDGGVIESAVETFLVPTGHVDMAFYPEGGDLAAGVEQTLYVELTDALGRPVEGRGSLVDQDGRHVAPFTTLHQGRGMLRATLEADHRYRLVLDQPSEVSQELPPADPTAVVLMASAVPGRAVSSVTAPHAGPWTVGVFCRGVLLAQDWFSGEQEDLFFDLPEEVAGVLRVTVFDAELKPVAERLVHAPARQGITVSVEPEAERALPGAPQALRFIARDEAGRPVRAVLGVAVRDRGVVSLADEAPTGLADSAWLLGDLEDLEDAPQFLGTDPESLRNVDLLLGTRGWRRFGWADPDALVAEHQDAGKRLLLREGRSDVPRMLDVGSKDAYALRRALREADQRARAATAMNVALLVLLAALAIGAFLAHRLRLPWPVLGLPAMALPLGALFAYSQLGAGAPGVAMDAAVAFEQAAPVPDAAVPVLEADLGLEERFADNEFLMGRGAQFGAPPMPALAAADQPGAALGEEPEEEAKAQADAPQLEGAFEREARLEADALRGLGYAGEDAEDGFADFDRAGRRARPLQQWLRTYAHRRTGPRDVRSDFTETVYWNPFLVTANDGTARVVFDLSDSVTTWEVCVDAHGSARVGQALGSFEAVPPVTLEAKLPVALTAGDRVQLPVAVECQDPSLTSVRFEAFLEGPLTLVGKVPATIDLVDGRGRVLLDLVAEAPMDGADAGRLALAAAGGGYVDRVVRDLVVRPRGFPHREARSGVVEDSAEFALALPERWEPGSLRAELTLYPSPLADLLAGLDGILQEPHGCFEQASTANYPNVLALGYLRNAGLAEPAAEARARELMERGYAKLVGYECEGDGFEWFGGSPAHESLSAYGLLQFHDMAQVFGVEPELLARTRSWLLSRRNGEGGYERNPRALDSFGAAPQATTDAYVTYALAVTGTPVADFAGELDRLEGVGLATEDPYVVALAASACQAAGRPEPAAALRQRLAAMQAEDGSLPGAEATITRSGERDRLTETTALAVLAWLDDPALEVRVRRGVEFLLSRRQGGRFGSTQATVQALRALAAYARFARRVASSGEAVLYVDDYEVARLTFEAGRREPLRFADLTEHLAPGAQRLRLELTGGNRFPWALDLTYASDQPASDPDAPLELVVEAARPVAQEGSALALQVRLRNLLNEGQPMALATVGLPAGLECPSAVLDALVEAGDVDFWELTEREVILYWRDLAPLQELTVNLECLARIPGEFTGQASRAALYYTPEAQHFAAPLTVEVN